MLYVRNADRMIWIKKVPPIANAANVTLLPKPKKLGPAASEGINRKL